MKKDSTSYGADRPAWDKSDCSVRALACATNVPYTVASVTFSARGRSVKKGTSGVLSAQLYEEVLGMREIQVASGMRLDEFLSYAPTGRFLVHKTGHAFAIIEGVVHDWDNTSKESTRLTRVWKVTEKALAKMQAMKKLVEELG